ncbi:MAG: monofunctional biosynthetic peptidoglycan transglycosylase [Candidatus Binatia bacterium]
MSARRKRRRSWRARVVWLVAVLVISLLGGLAVWELFFLRLSWLADPRSVRTLSVPTPQGSRELVVGPQSPYWTPLGSVSSMLVLCVVRAEDAKFYQHAGFDWDQLQDSFDTNVELRRYKRGGSTITMQLAKNLFLWREKSALRKALEVYLTWRLEQTLTKKRILELYLNVAEWGPGIYGIGEASRHYFGKPPSALTLGESALLAVTLPNPERWNLNRAPQFAMRRQQELLGRLRRENAIPDSLGSEPPERD